MIRRWLWVLWALCLLSAFACVAYPLYVIRPFRAQGAQELQLALAVTRLAFPVAATCAAAAVLFCVLLWGPKRSARIVAGLGALLACAFAALTRVNVYEIMFHRIDAPAFTAASDAKVDSDDMVLAVRVDGVARAYPVRTLTYHHIVNDRLNGAALAATY